MTNNLLGDVYAKVIEEVVGSSTGDFEESGVSQGVLQALQAEWQAKLSQRGVAHMPWDPKPVQAPPATATPAQASTPTSNATATANQTPNGSSNAYPAYNGSQPSTTANNVTRVKTEPGTENQVPVPNGYAPNSVPPQGGLARAQQLVQAQYGQAANASLNAMSRGGLALPGQQQSAAKPQGLQLPQQAATAPQQQLTPQQQAAMQRQHQIQQQQQQAQTRIKTENGSPELRQGVFQQPPALPNYSQTDGADESMQQWKNMLAERRANWEQHSHEADRLVRDHVKQQSIELSSGLMVPLEHHLALRNRKRKIKTIASPQSAFGENSVAGPSIPQLDGDVDDDEKLDIKDEDDENAINSDLDDSDDGKGAAGDDDEDFENEILCTYDKVQRVKNKWKCTLKDGVMAAGGKDWVFHKGMGEFEW